MKQLIILFLLGICLLGCSKEKKTNRLLHGKWTVNRSTTQWTNANFNSGKPSYKQEDNYATMEFDKNGKGKMIIPAGVDYYNGFAYPYDEETIELDAGVETILFTYDPEYAPEPFDMNWKWDKKMVVLSNGDIHYDNNTSSYYEVKFTCKKKD
ncbi:hypothetical protein D3C87_94460 [compost metagenome]